MHLGQHVTMWPAPVCHVQHQAMAVLCVLPAMTYWQDAASFLPAQCVCYSTACPVWLVCARKDSKQCCCRLFAQLSEAA